MYLKLAMLPLLATIALCGCGTYVPGVQEPPSDATVGESLVNLIVNHINCEVRDSIDAIYNQDHPRKKSFLDTWGVQITLSLQVEEKAGVVPVVTLLPPSPASAVFNLGIGGTLSSDATRIDKFNSYYTVAELKALGPCQASMRTDGIFILQSDLKLKEVLFESLNLGDTGQAEFGSDTSNGPLKQNVISHEVKFEILSSGNLTPGWKLKTVSINQSGTLFSASRDRTDDLTITFGPAVTTTVSKTVGGKKLLVQTSGPSEQAAYSHLASDIGLAVANGIRSALQQ